MTSSDGMPMMPWFHRDFLAATQGWTAGETGAYFLLLGAQWEMGPLPMDMVALASIARMTSKDFKAPWKKIERKFELTPAGLVNARLEHHRAHAVERRDRHRRGALQTNAKRWGSSSAVVVPIAERVAERQAGRSLSESPPSPSPSLKRLTRGERFKSREDLEGRSLSFGADGELGTGVLP
jgi:uncharacterized protein YdaU (DUF1376 family)